MARALMRVLVLIGMAHSAFAENGSNLRARQDHDQDRDGGDLNAVHGAKGSLSLSGGGGVVDWDWGWGNGRSLAVTDDPQCNEPQVNPCTVNTTAIGMLELGYASFYDTDCLDGTDGCSTEGVVACRTCFLSTEMYMGKTNTTEAALPDWVMCPCCVLPTLQTDHEDLEVQNFNYTMFDISGNDCTDAPTSSPGTYATYAPSQSAVLPDVAPTIAPTIAETPTPVLVSPAPTAEGTAEATPAESALASPAPTTDEAGGASTKNLNDADEDDGLGLGAKIGIGAGAALGVIVIGAVGFTVLKSSGRA